LCDFLTKAVKALVHDMDTGADPRRAFKRVRNHIHAQFERANAAVGVRGSDSAANGMPGQSNNPQVT
jgi:hypothetical protein